VKKNGVVFWERYKINAKAFKYSSIRERGGAWGVVLIRQTHGIWNIAVAFDNITRDP
jgi:hypothetical protein